MTIDELLDHYEPEFERAFLAGVEEITSAALIGKIAEALAAFNIERAIAILEIIPAAYREFVDALAKAYSDGGAAALRAAGVLRAPQGRQFIVRFNVRNPIAERFLLQHSSDLITRIVEDQKQAIRQAMQARLAEGVNPRTAALDIVGRIDRATGRRAGGIIGLTAAQERYVANARRELIDGDYAAYLRRERRDKRFDPTIRKAAREGRALTGIEIDRITGRYSDRLLQLRGETIARTETLTALRASQYEAARQLAESGNVDRDLISLQWKATRDMRTRDSHSALHNKVANLDQPFISPLTGAAIRYPGDPQAPAEEVINCRCALNIRVDWAEWAQRG